MLSKERFGGIKSVPPEQWQRVAHRPAPDPGLSEKEMREAQFFLLRKYTRLAGRAWFRYVVIPIARTVNRAVRFAGYHFARVAAVFCFVVAASYWLGQGANRVIEFAHAVIPIATGETLSKIAEGMGIKQIDPRNALTPIEIAGLACAENGLLPALCEAVCLVETPGCTHFGQVSSKGAIGMMQVMPDTAAELCPEFTMDEIRDEPWKGALCGARVLKVKIGYAKGDVPRGVRMYNGCRGKCSGAYGYSEEVLKEFWKRII